MNAKRECRDCGHPMPHAIQVLREDITQPIGFVDMPERLGLLVSCPRCGVWHHYALSPKGAAVDPPAPRPGADRSVVTLTMHDLEHPERSTQIRFEVEAEDLEPMMKGAPTDAADSAERKTTN